MLNNGNTYFDGGSLGLDTTYGNFTYSGAGVAANGGNKYAPFPLVKLGPNTLTLVGDNTNGFDGATIAGGTLQLGGANALVGAPVAVNVAGGLAFSAGITTFNVAGLSGSAGFSLTDAASHPVNLVIAGTDYSFYSGALLSSAGSLTVSSGTFVAAAPVSLPSYANVSVSAGAILGARVGGGSDFQSSDVDSLRGTATFQAGALLGFDTTDGNFTYGSNVGGSLGLAKLGPNTLILSGTNAYSGPTAVNSGILQLSNTAALSPSTAVTVISGGALAVNAGGPGEFTNATSGPGSIGGLLSSVTWNSGSAIGIDTTNAGGSLAYAGDVGGNQGLLKLGPGTLTLTSGSLTYKGATTVNGGSLVLTPTLVFSTNALSVASGGTLQINTMALNLEGGGNLPNVGPNIASFTGGGVYQVTGGGDWDLLGTYTGPGSYIAKTVSMSPGADRRRRQHLLPIGMGRRRLLQLGQQQGLPERRQRLGLRSLGHEHDLYGRRHRGRSHPSF